MPYDQTTVASRNQDFVRSALWSTQDGVTVFECEKFGACLVEASFSAKTEKKLEFRCQNRIIRRIMTASVHVALLLRIYR